MHFNDLHSWSFTDQRLSCSNLCYFASKDLPLDFHVADLRRNFCRWTALANRSMKRTNTVGFAQDYFLWSLKLGRSRLLFVRCSQQRTICLCSSYFTLPSSYCSVAALSALLEWLSQDNCPNCAESGNSLTMLVWFVPGSPQFFHMVARPRSHKAFWVPGACNLASTHLP